MRKSIGLVSIVAFSAMATLLVAGGYQTSTVGVGGYDLVSYHTDEGPVRGNGNHVVEHDDTTYLFSSRANRKAFESDPERYLPAYGGFCAFGVSVKKKFVGDPEVWRIENERVYLNLDKGIQKKWFKDIPGNIMKADRNWPEIRDTAPSEL